VLSPFFYFCCFRCVTVPLTGVINYVFCIYQHEVRSTRIVLQIDSGQVLLQTYSLLTQSTATLGQLSWHATQYVIQSSQRSFLFRQGHGTTDRQTDEQTDGVQRLVQPQWRAAQKLTFAHDLTQNSELAVLSCLRHVVRVVLIQRRRSRC